MTSTGPFDSAKDTIILCGDTTAVRLRVAMRLRILEQHSRFQVRPVETAIQQRKARSRGRGTGGAKAHCFAQLSTDGSDPPELAGDELRSFCGKVIFEGVGREQINIAGHADME